MLDDILDPYDPDAPSEFDAGDVLENASSTWAKGLLRPCGSCVHVFVGRAGSTWSMFLDIDSSLDRCHSMEERSPTLLTSRQQGYFLLRRCRRMRVHEMLKMQGIKLLPVQVITDHQLAEMAGNAMTQPVVEAIFAQLLPAVGLPLPGVA